MDRIIRIDNLSDIFTAGVKNFAESLLRSKAEEDDTVAYSVNGQVITLKAKDALWIYESLSRGLEDWEVVVHGNLRFIVRKEKSAGDKVL